MAENKANSERMNSLAPLFSQMAGQRSNRTATTAPHGHQLRIARAKCPDQCESSMPWLSNELSLRRCDFFRFTFISLERLLGTRRVPIRLGLFFFLSSSNLSFFLCARALR